MTNPSLVPAVFFDRDGVLIEDTGFPHREDQLILMPGAPEALRRLKALDYLTVIVTNQSGVARGMFSLDEMNAFNALVVERLGGGVDAIYSCPFHKDGSVPEWTHPDHPDRKPNPGMILKALAEHPIDPARSLMIGDRGSDLEAARRAGIPGHLFTGGDLDAFVSGLIEA